MQTVTTIGLDIAKSVFQVHAVDAAGKVIIRRQLKRRYVLAFFEKLPPCLIGIEACASSHHWSRELQALGHSVRLLPPAYVKPYVKRQKTTPVTLRPSVKLSPGPICGSSRPRPLTSRAACICGPPWVHALRPSTGTESPLSPLARNKWRAVNRFRSIASRSVN